MIPFLKKVGAVMILTSSFAYAVNDLDDSACIDSNSCRKLIEYSLVNTSAKVASTNLITIKNNSKRAIQTRPRFKSGSTTGFCTEIPIQLKANGQEELFLTCNSPTSNYSIGDADGRSNEIQIGDSGDSPTPTPPDETKVLYVFVTSTTYDGNLGGVAGADSICSSRAAIASGTAPWGTFSDWKAIISDPSQDAKDIVSATDQNLEVFQFQSGIGDVLVANSFSEMFGFPITLSQAIEYTELGNVLPSAGNVFTGSGSSGTYGGTSCNNWLSNSGLNDALSGNSSATDFEWISSIPLLCDETARLYCISRTGVVAP